LEVEYFKAEVLSAVDYYPFGMMMPDRQWYAGSDSTIAVNGFNGMRKDDEISGVGNSLDFGARIYDSRLGRWLSLDPLQSKYPSLSSYCFAANNPILFIDGRDIVPTAEFMSSVCGPVYLSLLADNSIFLKYAKPFMSFDPNIELKYEPGTTDRLFNANGWTSYKQSTYSPVKRSLDVESISMNSSRTAGTATLFGFTTTTRRTDIAIARTLIHETMHAYLAVNSSHLENYAGDDHEYMAEFMREDLKTGIKEYADKHGIQLDEDDLETLSWAGLHETDAWKNVYDTPEKQNAFFERVGELERNTTITDDETGEVIKSSGEDKNIKK